MDMRIRDTIEPHHTAPAVSGACWLVLTPSLDDEAWRAAIQRAAGDAGLRIVEPASEGVSDLVDPDVLLIVDNAAIAHDHGATHIAAIVPQPHTAHDAVAQTYGIVGPESFHEASVLLARAIALSDRHRVVTACELDQQPSNITLFDRLTITPPPLGPGKASRPAVIAALALYRFTPSQWTGSVPWSERIFIYDERAKRDSEILGDLDITGRARTLLYGPYLSLPPGRWRACMRFSVDDDAAKCLLRVDWGESLDFVYEVVTPQKAGLFEIALEHTWTQVARSEFRILVMQGAFAGKLQFLGGTAERVLVEAEDN